MNFELRVAGPDDVVTYDDELVALRNANAINKQYLADCAAHPGHEVLCVATVHAVEQVENLPEVPTCTKSQTAIDWGRVDRAEALGMTVFLTPALVEDCDHEWEGADGNPERCSKCGLSFMRFIHSCCP